MPVTLRQWEDSLRQPALCELLPVRDYLDGCVIRTNGCFVAGYETSGLNTFFHADETRNRTKDVLEALVRSLPERSMRMQVRYEVTDGHGDLDRALRQRTARRKRRSSGPRPGVPPIVEPHASRMDCLSPAKATRVLHLESSHPTTTARISSGGRRARRRTSGACRRTNASSERYVNMRIACRSLKV